MSRAVLLRPRSPSLPEYASYANYTFLDMDFGYGRGVKLLDKSPFKSHGDITAATWAAGVHGRCLDWEADSSALVTVPAAATQLNFTSEAFSIVARIYIENLTDNRWILSRYAFNVSGYIFGVHLTGYLSMATYQSGAGQESKSTASDCTTATWYTVGMSRSGTSIRLYLNGVDVTATVGTHTNPATCSDVAKVGLQYDGKMEFLRVFGGIALPVTAHAWYHNMLK